MASFNRITIVGYLGKDPEIRYTPDGQAVCNFSVATSERRKDRTGEAQEITTWFKITVWGKRAEVANQYLAKGKQIYIEGTLRQEEWTDREGTKRTSLVVNASDFQFLGTKGDEGGSGFQSQSSQGQKPERQADNDNVDTPSDNDIPF
ncbi:MAG: single-stranded DNA-binding protein [Acidobacteria bacterium]|nr:single-stranded DNA-binding protein [Acidobacteriota bacterium]